jgi:hypothetical protein
VSGPDVGGEDPAVEVAAGALRPWLERMGIQGMDRAAAQQAVGALRSAGVLSPGQRERELEEALRLVMYYADNGWDTRSGFGEAICEARAALSVGEEERHED